MVAASGGVAHGKNERMISRFARTSFDVHTMRSSSSREERSRWRVLYDFPAYSRAIRGDKFMISPIGIASALRLKSKTKSRRSCQSACNYHEIARGHSCARRHPIVVAELILAVLCGRQRISKAGKNLCRRKNRKSGRGEGGGGELMHCSFARSLDVCLDRVLSVESKTTPGREARVARSGDAA
jgi:hypothetical protein